MLKQRVITALILIPLVIALIYYLPPPAFCILTGLITLAAAWEWTNLMEVTHLGGRFLYIVIMGWILFGMLFVPTGFVFLVSFALWLVATVMVAFYPRGSAWWAKSLVWRGVMGVFVLVPCWAALNYIRNQENGFYALLFLFVLIWGADIGAYFVGRKWGKHKLAPTVSPGKSVEGFFAALGSAIIIALLAAWFTSISIQIWPWCVLIALVTVAFSVIGDLFESMLKRQAGLKDSGKLLPGHGGLLDRIDSLTAAAPVFVFVAWLLSNYVG